MSPSPWADFRKIDSGLKDYAISAQREAELYLKRLKRNLKALKQKFDKKREGSKSKVNSLV